MPDWVPLNGQILFNPMNWVIVILMVLIASYAWTILTSKTSLATGA